MEISPSNLIRFLSTPSRAEDAAAPKKELTIWNDGQPPAPHQHRSIERAADSFHPAHSQRSQTNQTPNSSDAFDAPPGAAPFYRFLQAVNLASPKTPSPDTQPDSSTANGPSSTREPTDASTSPPSKGAGTTQPNGAKVIEATLADVAPREQAKAVQQYQSQQVIQRHTGTGSLIDLTV